MILDPLPPDVQALLDAERNRAGPPPEARARVLGAIALQLPAAVASSSVTSASAAGAKAASGVMTKAFALKVVVGVALATGGGVVLTERLARPPEPPRSEVVAPPRAEVKPVEVTEPEPPPPPPPVKSPRKPPAPVKEQTPEIDDALTSERLLLERAREAMVDGDTAGALTFIGHHARLFPEGRLAEEREGLSVQILLSAGRYQEARERAAKFDAAYPNSILKPVIKAVLDSAALMEKPGSPQ